MQLYCSNCGTDVMDDKFYAAQNNLQNIQGWLESIQKKLDLNGETQNKFHEKFESLESKLNELMKISSKVEEKLNQCQGSASSKLNEAGISLSAVPNVQVSNPAITAISPSGVSSPGALSVATVMSPTAPNFSCSNSPTVMSNREANETVQKILPKFIAYRDVRVIQDSLNEHFSTEANSGRFVHFCIVYSLQKYDFHEIIAPLFANLLDVKHNHFTASFLADRFHEIISSAQDYIVTYPKFWDVVAKILAHTLTSETFDFAHLKLSCGFILKLEIRKYLLSQVFQVLSSCKSPSWIRLKWKKSNVLLNQFLPDDYVGTFITLNNLVYLIDPKAPELISASETPSFNERKALLSRILQHTSDNTLNSVIDWANAHFGSPPYSSPFIRPLVTAIFELSIKEEMVTNGRYRSSRRVFELHIMDHYHCIIDFFVTPDPSLQRHCLCALAMLMHGWNFPEGVAESIISYLLHRELISLTEFENLKSIENQVLPEFIEGLDAVRALIRKWNLHMVRFG